MIVFVEPNFHDGYNIKFITNEAAIGFMREVERRHEREEELVTGHIPFGDPYPDDMCLEEVVKLLNAKTLDETIETMAEAMWKHWASQSSGLARVCSWEQVVREPWRGQARAALKALGVPLP